MSSYEVMKVKNLLRSSSVFHYTKLSSRCLMLCSYVNNVVLAVTTIIFMFCLFYMREITFCQNSTWRSDSLHTQHQLQKACHSIQLGPEKSKEQRCYPLLINFADRCCEHAQARNCQTGLKNGFRQCVSYNRTIFNDDPGFLRRNQNILNRNRGAGYWLWKPYVIFRELYVARDGDIIVYSDAAANIIRNIEPLTGLTLSQDVIVFQLKCWNVRNISVQKISESISFFDIINISVPHYPKSVSDISRRD